MRHYIRIREKTFPGCLTDNKKGKETLTYIKYTEPLLLLVKGFEFRPEL